MGEPALKIESTPTLKGFDPRAIPWQWETLQLIRSFDYSKGNLNILFSGTLGSAKSAFAAHIVATHCMLFPRARFVIARRSLPDLRRTIFREVVDHIHGDLVDGKDFWYQETTCNIQFKNGSEVMPATWSDRKYKKFRSLNISGFVIEEAIENDDQDKEAFDTLNQRLRRLPHVWENIGMCLTNPGEPDHWLHEYFIDQADMVIGGDS